MNTRGRVIEDEYAKASESIVKKGKVSGGKLHKKYFSDAGLDIMADENFTVPAGGQALVGTGLRIQVPYNTVGLLKSRSGLSVKHGIEIGAGVLDHSYTGEVKVVLRNFSNLDFKGEKGDRIAQMLTIPVNLNQFVQVEYLDESDRGEDGFGASGVKGDL